MGLVVSRVRMRFVDQTHKNRTKSNAGFGFRVSGFGFRVSGLECRC